MITRQFLELSKTWPATGRHILASYDAESIVVYQAYRPAIARYAAEYQQFGGEFSYSRMSWIKPNFLWMMYRSGWATKPGQEHILAVRPRRSFFDELLRLAVPSTYHAHRFPTHEDWQAAVARSEVRLQWDPDHGPHGNPLERRAVQLGLRGSILHRYGTSEVLSIEDITPFVIEQREHLPDDLADLQVPDEAVYLPDDAEAAKTVGIDRDFRDLSKPEA